MSASFSSTSTNNTHYVPKAPQQEASPQSLTCSIKQTALRVANQVLKAPQEASAASSCCSGRHYRRHCCSDSIFWYSRPVYIIDSYPVRRRRGNEDFDAARVLAVFAGSLVMAAASYVIHSSYANWQQVKKQLAQTRVHQEKLGAQLDDSMPCEERTKLNKIVQLTGKVLKRMNLHEQWKLNTTIAIFASGILAVVGGIIASPHLMAAGITFGLGIGTLVLFNECLRGSGQGQFRDANELASLAAAC